MADSRDLELWQRASELLDQLLDHPADRRKAELEQMTTDPVIRKRVEAMLAADAESGMLDHDPVSQFTLTTESLSDPQSGQVHGPYRLESMIARGGMSTVYRAVRVDGAYDSVVAFKLLSTALMASNWAERFRRETDLLARLRHPGIASLLDAGVTEDGRPYLVTELVDGEPIHRWCEHHEVDLRERVALIVQLCKAVAHAQKQLIVHRDIKADNVLVNQDGQVKLLDFGIARRLSETSDSDHRTTLTRIFTPEYAAPEQLSGDPISTATDVFSIGALLYRLLTGELPFATLTASGHRQPITQPSRKVKTAAGLDRVERQRRWRLLRGDLDNIVARALAEDPADRYSNAQQLGEDLDNWLAHRPVNARKASLGRRMLLFTRRRTALAASLAGLVLVTVIGVSGVFWQAREARIQATEAMVASERALAVSEFMVSLFESADPDLYGNRPPDARELLAQGRERAQGAFAGQPEIRRELLLVLGRLDRKLGNLDEAERSIVESEALDSNRLLDRVRARMVMAGIHFDRGQPEAAVEMTSQAIKELPDDVDDFTRTDLKLLHANSLVNTGRSGEAIEVTRHLLDELGTDAVADLRLAVLAELSGFLVRASRLESAREIAEQASALIEQGHGSPTVRLSHLGNHSFLMTELGLWNESIALQQQALQLLTETYPEGHRRHAQFAGNLATRLSQSGRWQEADHYFAESLEAYSRLYPEPNLHSASVHNNYGLLLIQRERYSQALPHLKIARGVAREVFGEDDPRHLSAWTNLAFALSMTGHETGEGELQAVLEARSRSLGKDSLQTAVSHGLLADHWLRSGNVEQAMLASQRAMDIIALHADSTRNEILMTMVHRARALDKAGRDDQALELYEATMERARALGPDVGFVGLRLIDYYTEFLAERDPLLAHALAEEWLNSELAGTAAESPQVRRLEQRLAGLSPH